MKRLLTICTLSCVALFAKSEQESIAKSAIPCEFDSNLGVTSGGVVCADYPTIFHPKETKDIVEILNIAWYNKRKVRAIGAMTSINASCLSPHYLISLDQMNQLIEVGHDYITVEAGMRVGTLCQILENHGLSLEVIGATRDQTVGGALSSGARGQNPSAGSLASQVIGLEIVNGRAKVRNLRWKKDRKEISATVSGMGLLGVITKVTFKCKPLFLMTELVSRMNMNVMLSKLDSLLKYDKLVMFWNTDNEEVKIVSGHRVDFDLPKECGNSFDTLGSAAAINSMENYPSTLQRVGKSWEILMGIKSHRPLRLQDYNAGVLQGEYAVPIKQLPGVIEEARRFFRYNHHRLRLVGNRMVVQISPIKADEVWLSPSYDQDAVSLSFHDFERPLEWTLTDADQFIEWENILKKKFNVRPHLGKHHFFSDKELKKAFPKWNAFKKMRKKADPKSMFVTPYMERLFK